VLWKAANYTSGIYFAKLETADQSMAIKMILLK